MASVVSASSPTTDSPGQAVLAGALRRTLTSRQRLVADSGRDSSMRTVSPIRASLVSSWALNLVDKRMTRLYSRWRARRSTDTTIVLSILSLTTRPTFVFRFACTLVVCSCHRVMSLQAVLPSLRSRWTVRIRAIVRRVCGIVL